MYLVFDIRQSLRSPAFQATMGKMVRDVQQMCDAG